MLKSIHRCYRRYQQLARYARSASLEIRSVATNFTPESSKLARASQQFTPGCYRICCTQLRLQHMHPPSSTHSNPVAFLC